MSSTSPYSSLALTVLGTDDFRGTLLTRPGTWAVGFAADWCPFCHSFVPAFAALSHPGFELARVDLTSYEDPLWDRFQIEVVPSVIVFRDGRTSFRIDGELAEGLDANNLAAIEAAARAKRTGGRATS
jgi:thiol-disulfide isomerase/thioredoxin